MDFEKLFKLFTNYLSDYVWTFIKTIRNPELRFQPLANTDDQQSGIVASSQIEQTNTLINPKLFGFVLISIFIGLTISKLIPGDNPQPDLATSAIVIVFYWLLYSSLVHIVCRIFAGKGTFSQTLSISLQLLSVIYVIASFVALMWGTFVTGTKFGALLASTGNLPAYLVERPIYMYFVVQFGLLTIYLPIAVKRIHGFNWSRLRYAISRGFLATVSAIFVILVFCLVFLALSFLFSHSSCRSTKTGVRFHR
jgi:hypothetical protein